MSTIKLLMSSTYGTRDPDAVLRDFYKKLSAKAYTAEVERALQGMFEQIGEDVVCNTIRRNCDDEYILNLVRTHLANRVPEKMTWDEAARFSRAVPKAWRAWKS